MAAEIARLRTAEKFVPAGRGDFGDADVLAAAPAAYRGCVALYSAHAKGADANERAIGHVISDISGTTGQAIIKAIVGGERDPRTRSFLSANWEVGSITGHGGSVLSYSDPASGHLEMGTQGSFVDTRPQSSAVTIL